MPCRPNVEEFTTCSHLPCHVEPADGGDVNTYEIDQPLGDEKNPLVAVDEQLPHCNRATRLLPQCAKPRNVLGRERVLHEDWTARLHSFAQLDRLIRRNSFMNIVEQLDIEDDLRPELLKHSDRVVHIRSRLEYWRRCSTRRTRLLDF